MTIHTRSDLLTAADVIYSETTPLANTANRVGQMFKDIIDSVTVTSEHPTVRAVSTSNLTLSGTAQSADGVTLDSVGDTVLAAGQTTQVNRGPWVVQSGPWTRPSWFATGINAGGFLIQVQEGTDYSDTTWECTTNDPDAVVDTDDLAWQLQAAQVVNASRPGLAPAVSETAGAVAYSTGSAQAYQTTVRVGTNYLAVGATVATVGTFRTINNFSLYGLTGGGADAKVLNLTASDDLYIGDGTNVDDVLIDSANRFIYRNGTTAQFTAATTGISVSPGGAAVSGTGMVRGPANFTGYGLNGAAANSRIWGISTNDLLLGDATNLTNTKVSASTSVSAYVGANAAWTATATTHSFKSGATTYLTIGADYVKVDAASLYFGNPVVGPVISQAQTGDENADSLQVHAQNVDVTVGGPFTAGKLQLAAGYITADGGAGTSSGGNVEVLVGRYQATGQLTAAVFGEDVYGEYLELGSATSGDYFVRPAAQTGTAPGNELIVSGGTASGTSDPGGIGKFCSGDPAASGTQPPGNYNYGCGVTWAAGHDRAFAGIIVPPTVAITNARSSEFEHRTRYTSTATDPVVAWTIARTALVPPPATTTNYVLKYRWTILSWREDGTSQTGTYWREGTIRVWDNTGTPTLAVIEAAVNEVFATVATLGCGLTGAHPSVAANGDDLEFTITPSYSGNQYEFILECLCVYFPIS